MLLAIDSSLKGYSGALQSESGELLFSFFKDEQKSQNLIPDLQNAFAEHQLRPELVKNIVVNPGPGSFTGIRTALTLVNTMAANLDLNLIPVNNFQLLRFMHPGKKTFAFSASSKNPKEFFVSLDEDYDNIETNFYSNDLAAIDSDLEVLDFLEDKNIAEYLLSYVKENKVLASETLAKTLKPYYLREPSLRLAKTK